MARTDLWLLHPDQGLQLGTLRGVSHLGTLTGAQGWLCGAVPFQSCLGHPHPGSTMGWVRAMSCGNPWRWSLAARGVGDIQHQGIAVPPDLWWLFPSAGSWCWCRSPRWLCRAGARPGSPLIPPLDLLDTPEVGSRGSSSSGHSWGGFCTTQRCHHPKPLQEMGSSRHRLSPTVPQNGDTVTSRMHRALILHGDPGVVTALVPL